MNNPHNKNISEDTTSNRKPEHPAWKTISENQTRKLNFKGIILIAASVSIFISLGILNYTISDKKNTSPAAVITPKAGIHIPKTELAESTNIKADMIGLIVYKGRIYTQTNTRIKPELAEKLLDKKLGTTKGNIDEWSKQKDYEVEFASTIGKTEVYSVKGYEESFRIMTYGKHDGTPYSEFFECFEEINVIKGSDIFDRLKIENNIKTVKQENFESWNHNKQEYGDFKDLEAINNFIKDLKNAVPYTQQSLSYLFNREGDANQKFIYLNLSDGSEVQLQLFKEGYVFYGNSHLFFKMNGEAFNKIWN